MSKIHVKTGDTVILLTGKDEYQYNENLHYCRKNCNKCYRSIDIRIQQSCQYYGNNEGYTLSPTTFKKTPDKITNHTAFSYIIHAFPTLIRKEVLSCNADNTILGQCFPIKISNFIYIFIFL